ncbi:MAG TPA: hypothetical protein VFK33_11925 [Bacillales bacterium]|nr:hypothetical protein [Bacillales bacterium]
MDFFSKSLSYHAKIIHHTVLQEWSFSKRMVFTAFLGTLACLFQSAGGYLPGIGYFISPLATAPIMLAFVLAFRSGCAAYAITLILLLLIQPSELIVFPFTTGLLGASLGVAFIRADRRISVLLSGGIALFAGILFLLFGIGFPVLGPGVASSFNWTVGCIVLAFSILYSWVWTEIGAGLLKRLFRILSPSKSHR